MTSDVPELIGRAADVDRVRDALASGRLVTLVGAAGVGKSALARAIGRDRASTVLVDATAASAARALARSVAQAAGVPRAQRTADLTARAAEALDARGALLVLDDVVARDAAREVVGTLLQRSTHLRVLVTTRAPLGAPEEHTCEVAPLAREDAIALFRARGRVEGADPSAVAAVVERLDGLPLAIVLAASRSAVLSMDALLARLDEPLRVLRAGPSLEGTLRHSTIAQSIDASFSALGEEERAALACASMFEGPFTADAFEAVAASALAADALDVLEAILRQSLLERVPAAGAVRFCMLNVIRAFARERALDVLGRERHEMVRAAYEASVVRAAARCAEETYGPRAERALSALETMLPDVLSVFASARGERPARAAAAWLALFDPILFGEAVTLDDARFAAAVEAADRADDVRLRVRTRVLRARAGLELGPPERAAGDLDEAFAIVTSAPDAAPALVAEVRRSRGWMQLASGKPSEAIDELEAALVASVVGRDPRGHADALAAMGLAEHMLGRAERGRESLDLARALHAGQGDELRRRRVEDMLRLVTPAGGESPEGTAEDVLRAAAARHEAGGQSSRAALDLALLAALEEARGESGLAAEHRTRARAAARVAGLGAIEKALDAAVVRPPTTSAPSRASVAVWRIGEDARSVVRPDGETLDLVRHGSLRRVLQALVLARRERPGAALAAGDVLAAGWPGERVMHDAGLLRVYSAIRRLRRMGFEEVLITRDDGYLLDPAAAFEADP